MQIPVVRNVLEANEKMAAHVRARLNDRGILALNLISSPGAGKTTLLERTLTDLASRFNMAVIEGDLQTDNDARRVAATGAQAVQINTEGGCHLDSNLVLSALEKINLEGLDILFIENVGNLVVLWNLTAEKMPRSRFFRWRKATTSRKNTHCFFTWPKP